MAEFSFKELYDVTLKATSNIEELNIQANETVAAFDKIQLGSFTEHLNVVTAHGGYEDRDRVWWESVKDVGVVLTQGIFSTEQLAVMTNSRLVTIEQDEPIYINKRIIKTANDEGAILFEDDIYNYLFVYRTDTGEKITDYVPIDGGIANLVVGRDYLLDYDSRYDNGAKILRIGSQLSNGFLTLQGKTRVKDDITGMVRTGIITIPKLKLMTSLSIKLGGTATPVLGRCDAVACPTGSRGNTIVMELRFLDEDIDSDI